MNKTSSIPVWDPLVRLFHWLLVGAFAASWLTQEEHYELHLQAGYTCLGLIAVRIIWGFAGSKHARFNDFLYPPSAIYRYIKSLVWGHSKRFIGHNPLGGLMIIFLLLDLLTISISGIALDAAENWSGPMADLNLFQYKHIIHTSHVQSTNLMLILILAHLLGVIHSSWVHRENLIRAMISGKKRPP